VQAASNVSFRLDGMVN